MARGRRGYILINADKQVQFSRTASITPTLGSELLGNPGFETAGGGGADIWGSWLEDSIGDGGFANETTTIHGGSNAAKITAGPSKNTTLYQRPNVTAGTWYQHSFWTAGDGTNTGRHGVYDMTNGAWIQTVVSTGVSAATYAQVFSAFRAPTLCAQVEIDHACSLVETGVHYVDDDSLKALTLSSCLTLVGDPGVRTGNFTCAPTLTAGTQAGMAIGVDDETNPTYGLFVYHDGTNVHLVRLEAGVWATESINTAATYVGGGQFYAVPSGNDWSIYYRGVQVSTAQTIDTSSYGTKVCGFSTLSSNQVGQIVYDP